MKKILLLIFITYFSTFAEDLKYQQGTARVRFAKGVGRIQQLQILNSLGLEVMMPALKPEQSVTYNLGKSLNLSQAATNNISQILKTEEVLLRTYRLRFSMSKDPLKVIHQLNRIPEIEVAEPVWTYYIQGIEDFNDPFINNQKLLETIQAFEAWEIEAGNPEIVVGVSDNGVLQSHEDLVKSIATNENEAINESDTDMNGYVDDYDGYNFAPSAEGSYNVTRNGDNHGTIVAGIIAGTPNNGKGIVGVANKCKFFPIKVSEYSETGRGIHFGYESITYAAVRGFRVLNCSWGLQSQKPFSQIEQSIIDHAVAMGVTILASGGNPSSGEAGPSRAYTNYPACYKGVLAVGETDQFDRVSSGSSLGSHVRIMAPGIGNYTTGNSSNTDYRFASSGTSFASPVVAGVASIMYSRWQNLTPMQGINFLRQCTDDILESQSDQLNNALIPGRVNMLKVVQTDPMSMPGFEINFVRFTDTNGNPIERFSQSQEVDVYINVTNHLGSAQNLLFALNKAADYSGNTVELLKSDYDLAATLPNQTHGLGPFRIRVNTLSNQKVVFRLDIYGQNNYSDFLKFDFYPNVNYRHFKNDKVNMTMFDRGVIGSEVTSYDNVGRGFEVYDVQYGLYTGGIVANLNKAISFGSTLNMNDFQVVRPFGSVDSNTTVITTNPNQNNTLQIVANVIPDRTNEPFVTLLLNGKNTGFSNLNYMAMGIYMDWDLGYGRAYESRNYTELCPDCIPEFLQGRAVAQISYNDEQNRFFGQAISSSDEMQFNVLSGGFLAGTNSFSRAIISSALASGSSLQTENMGDVYSITGIGFDGPIEMEEERNCFICISGGKTKQELEENLKSCLNKAISSKEFVAGNDNLIYPNPSVGLLNFDEIIGDIIIFDTMGKIVFSAKVNSSTLYLPENLINGVYFYKIASSNHNGTFILNR